MIVGICGGYQMLGNNIEDPHTLESNTGNEKGLKLLSLNTILEKEKSLSQTQAICKGTEIKITGYEIHHGNTDSDEKPFILNNKNEVIGVKKGNIWGTYLHGIFDNNELRRHVINIVRGQKKLKPLPVVDSYNLDIEISKLADILRKSLDLKKIYKLMGL
jgi:cobyric acid synthase